MVGTEQQYYEMLVRTDHPVFKRDFSAVTDSNSPFNSVLNRIFAKQLVRIRTYSDSMETNSFPQTVDADGIDRWEDVYFGETFPQKSLTDRIAALMKKRNNPDTMNVATIIAVSQLITGLTPIVIRNGYFGGWVLDQAALDFDSIFSGTDQAKYAQTYYVIFKQPVSTSDKQKLDNELTQIEKGGSVHFIFAPIARWVLDRDRLDIDTRLG